MHQSAGLSLKDLIFASAVKQKGTKGNRVEKLGDVVKMAAIRYTVRLLHVETDRTSVSEFMSVAESKLKLKTEPLQKHQRPEATSSCYLTFGMKGKSFTGGPYKVENTTLHSSNGIIDNWTEYPRANNNIESQTLSTNPQRSIRSEHLPKNTPFPWRGNRPNLPVREYKQ